MATTAILTDRRSQRSDPLHKVCRKIPDDPITWVNRQIDRLKYAGFAVIKLITSFYLWRVMQSKSVTTANLVNVYGQGGHRLMLFASWVRQLLALLCWDYCARSDKQNGWLQSDRPVRLNTQREWSSAHMQANRLP